MTRFVTYFMLALTLSGGTAWGQPNLIFKDPKDDFLIQAQIPQWQLITEESLANDGRLFVVKRPSGTGQMITVMSLRRDQTQFHSARAYALRWLKDMPKFGFEVQDTRPRKIAGISGYSIDVKAPQADKIVHQLILHQKQNEMLVFTCSDQQDRFKETLSNCQKIISSFKILKKASQKTL